VSRRCGSFRKPVRLTVRCVMVRYRKVTKQTVGMNCRLYASHQHSRYAERRYSNKPVMVVSSASEQVMNER